ncbi:MAG: hypothetical protein ACYCQI_11225 [Gammaproteobacteria bacterium]
MSITRSREESKDEPRKLYEAKLAQYLEESKDMTSLEKHVFMFMDKEKTFSPSTVTAGLNRMHGVQADMKGRFISLFNASHGSDNIVCPELSAQFTKDKNGYARFLHLGTTRIWNADGTINQARWEQFINYIKVEKEEKEPILTLSKLKSYLAECVRKDPQDPTTHRNSNAFFSSKYVQHLAATAAWDEVFNRLACGWKEVPGKPGTFEAYLSYEVTQEFFTDSPRAFLRAECNLLPVPKPEPEIVDEMKGIPVAALR